MKSLFKVLCFVFGILTGCASDTPLIPEPINELLGQIKPDMPDEELNTIIKQYYPDARSIIGDWSGGTGYADFILSPRYHLSVAEYMDLQPGKTNSEEIRKFEDMPKYVHPSMTFYVYDREQEFSIHCSSYNRDKTKNIRSEPDAGAE